MSCIFLQSHYGAACSKHNSRINTKVQRREDSESRNKYLTCQLGTKYGTPSLTPISPATKIWPISWDPKISAVTRAPGRPSVNKPTLSNVDLEHQKSTTLGLRKLCQQKHPIQLETKVILDVPDMFMSRISNKEQMKFPSRHHTSPEYWLITQAKSENFIRPRNPYFLQRKYDQIQDLQRVKVMSHWRQINAQ